MSAATRRTWRWPQRKAEAELLAGEVESLEGSLNSIEGKAGQVGATVQFRTGETVVRDSDRARIARLGALLAGLGDVRVRVSGFADSRGDDELNQTLSQERAESVARELEKAGVPKDRLVDRGHGRALREQRGTAGRPGLRALRRDPPGIHALSSPATDFVLVPGRDGRDYALTPRAFLPWHRP